MHRSVTNYSMRTGNASLANLPGNSRLLRHDKYVIFYQAFFQAGTDGVESLFNTTRLEERIFGFQF